MTRDEFLQSLVPLDRLGLEVGPSHSPVFPKRQGLPVEIVDHTDAATLRTKYDQLGIDASRIEEVDYVSDGSPLDSVVPRHGEYGYIFSSHSIEHLTDVVGFLQSCEILLAADGRLLLAVPDKRYTFDGLRHPSTTGEILEAHEKRARRHSLGSIYDFQSNLIFQSGLNVWTQWDTGDLVLEKTPQIAKRFFDEAARSDKYIDNHGWCFTPASFRLMLHDLSELGLTALREEAILDTGLWEFYVLLSRSSAAPAHDRLALTKAVMREQVVSGLQMLAADEPLLALALEVIRQPVVTRYWD